MSSTKSHNALSSRAHELLRRLHVDVGVFDDRVLYSLNANEEQFSNSDDDDDEREEREKALETLKEASVCLPRPPSSN
eukprot:727249-Hanusia_phi.AAC.5